MKKFISPLFVAVSLASCVSANNYSRELHSSNEREMTVGVVQREIHRGMSSSEVAEQLGSPNIVERDAEDRDVWIYDKIATEASFSMGSEAGAGLVGAGGSPGALILGGVGGLYAKSAGASATTQKTLTVVIRFDRQNRVESFSYHSSTF